MTNAIIWTKNNSEDCLKAGIIAQRMGLTVEVRNIDSGAWDLAKLQAAIPGAKTVPQVVINDVVIGGLAQLVAKAKEQQQAAPKVSLNAADRQAASNATDAAAHEAKNAAIADRLQAHQAAKLAQTPEQRQAAIAKTNAMRAAISPAPAVSLDQATANHQAAQAARADRLSAVKAANADARAARITANKQRVEAAKAARRQRVGVA